MADKCYICNTDLEKVSTAIVTSRGDYSVKIDGITAMQCPKCGEQVLDYEEAEMIQEITKALASAKKENQPEFLNVSEVADILRVSNQTVYNMLKEGRLPAVKAGREWRFSRDTILNFLQQGTTQEETIAARGNKISKKDQQFIREIMDDIVKCQ